MGMIGEDKILEIRGKSSIVEVVSDHLTLKKMGQNYVGLCPFHAENTPSFTVNEEKGIFHCFGCGVGGNIFSFLMQFEHLSFPEAVEKVAKRYGVQLDRLERPFAKNQRSDRLYRLNERAAAYFHKALSAHPEGKRALQYLKTRGIDERTSRRFYLGYAPSSGPGLAAFLQRDGWPLRDAVSIALVTDRGNDKYGDKFFGRLIFPIIDAGGKVTGFGGRTLGDGLPKYLNSAETPLFHKGAQLYGLFQAKEGIRSMDRVVVVEGYLDVLALSQAGLSWTVATMGTALTPDHVRLLRRYTKNVIALFDGDEAGRKAAARSFEIFVEGGLLGQAAFLPQGEDPDTFVRSRGRQALESVLEQAVPMADYYFTWLQGRHGANIEGKSQIAQEVSRVLAKVTSPFEVDLLSRRAAEFLGIREELLRHQPDKAGKAVTNQGQASPAAHSGRIPEDRAESSLVALMLRFPEVLRRLEKEEFLERIVHPGWKETLACILSEWRERGEVNLARLTLNLPPHQASALAALAIQGESIQENESRQMTEDCLLHLHLKYLKGLESDLCRAIRLAEEKMDEKARKERILEWQEVVQKERNLEQQRYTLRTGLR